MHLNSFAILSNLASYSQNFHQYASQKIINFVEFISKKLFALKNDIKLIESKDVIMFVSIISELKITNYRKCRR